MASALEKLGGPFYNVEQTSNSPLYANVDEYNGYFSPGMDNATYRYNGSDYDTEEIDNRRLEVIIPIAAVMSIVSLMTSIGNALVIIAVRTDRRLRTVSNYFILSLAFADLLIGILVMPLSIIFFVEGKWLLGLIVCQTWLTTDYVTCTASIFSLFILSLDRYWSIRSPLKYMKKRTPRRAGLMIGMAWCMSCLWIIPVWGWHYFEHEGERKVASNDCDTEFRDNIVFKVLTAIFNFYIPLVFMLFVYGKIFVEIRARSKMCVGRRSSGSKRSPRSKTINHARSLPSAHDAPVPSNESREEEERNPSWVPEFDSLTSSKSTSQEVGDMSESCPTQIMMRRIGKGEVDKQLKNISHLTLATMGLAGIVAPSNAVGVNTSGPRRIRIRRTREENPLTIKQVKRIIPEERSENQSLQIKHNFVIPTIREPSNGEICEQVSKSEENGGIPMIEINGNVLPNSPIPTLTLTTDEPNVCPNNRPPNGTSKRRISFTVDSVASKEELEPLRKSSHEDRRASSMKYKGVRYSTDNSSPTHLLPGDPGSPDVQSGRQHLKPDSMGKSSAFSRFSLRHGKTSEYLKERIRRFSLNKERKAVKQLGIIVSCFIICWLPYFISFLIVAYCPTCVHPNVHFALIWLGYLNSTMNPFIYPMCNSNFRKAFKKIFGITSCRSKRAKQKQKLKPQQRSLYRRPRAARY